MILWLIGIAFSITWLAFNKKRDKYKAIREQNKRFDEAKKRWRDGLRRLHTFTLTFSDWHVDAAGRLQQTKHKQL